MLSQSPVAVQEAARTRPRHTSWADLAEDEIEGKDDLGLGDHSWLGSTSMTFGACGCDETLENKKIAVEFPLGAFREGSKTRSVHHGPLQERTSSHTEDWVVTYSRESRADGTCCVSERRYWLGSTGKSCSQGRGVYGRSKGRANAESASKGKGLKGVSKGKGVQPLAPDKASPVRHTTGVHAAAIRAEARMSPAAAWLDCAVQAKRSEAPKQRDSACGT